MTLSSVECREITDSNITFGSTKYNLTLSLIHKSLSNGESDLSTFVNKKKKQVISQRKYDFNARTLLPLLSSSGWPVIS